MSESPPRTLLIAQRSTAYACSAQYQSVEMSGEACWLLPGMLFARKFEAGWDDPVGCSTGSFFSPTRRWCQKDIPSAGWVHAYPPYVGTTSGGQSSDCKHHSKQMQCGQEKEKGNLKGTALPFGEAPTDQASWMLSNAQPLNLVLGHPCPIHLHRGQHTLQELRRASIQGLCHPFMFSGCHSSPRTKFRHQSLVPVPLC